MSLQGDIPVKVAIRCRPLSTKERREGCQMCIEVVDGEPQLILGGNHPFTYDHVFSPMIQQQKIYDDCVQTLIDNIFKGYNVTILAYGQTGSGKTYTMGTAFGMPDVDVDINDDDSLGVIPRAITELFNKIAVQDKECKYSVKVSFLEIYKEDILDLLTPSGRKEEVAIREDREGVKVTGLYEVPVLNTKHALQLLQQGSLGRTTASTAMNATSSRSHAIFTVMLQKNDVSDTVTAKLHFVDLAGSERVKKTKAEGDRFKEGVNINLGLLTLGNVISALSEGRNGHVPYREAKLTRLLQDSLGGNSHTVMIACISPADFNFEETLNTLRYAQRARKIKNKPIVNRDPHAAEVARLKQLVQQLQMQLLQQNGGQSSIAESVAAIEVKALVIQNRKLGDENEKLTLELQNAIDQTTTLYEKAFMAEMARDKMKVKLEELRVKMGLMTDSFNLSADLANGSHCKERIEMFQDLKEKILELQTEHKIAEENLSKCGLESIVDAMVDGDGVKDDPQDACITNEITSEVTLRQAKMNRELQEINKLLAKKEELAGRLVMSDDKINSMKQSYEAMMHDLESEVTALQKEKEELSQALRVVKANTVYNKVSEQRRKRLQELEGQIGELRRKIVEYSKMAKMKEQSDRKVTRLNEEIQELKHARVRLVRQMRSEAERLRLWKMQKEKEVCKLRQQDQRRQVELVKKEQQFSKQQNVMRIKMDEAMSVNKRLKDVLQKQKLSAQQRKEERERTAMLKSRTTTGMDVVKQRIVEWITQELDLVVSAREAKYHLDSLMNDRVPISAQLNKLKSRANKGNSSSATGSDSSSSAILDGEVEEKIRELNNDLQLRNVQISDLQQKLFDVEQDEKGGSKFDSLQTMNEAKCALRWLFDTAASNKVELAVKHSNLQEKVGDYEEAVRAVEATQAQLNDMARNYEEQLHALKEEQEDKVLYLLAELQKSAAPNETVSDALVGTNEDHMKRIKFQEAEIKELSNVREDLIKSKERVKKLETDLLEIKIRNHKMPSEFATPGPYAARKRASSILIKKRVTSDREALAEFYALSPDTEETDDAGKDPDWQRTPIMKRIQKLRSNSHRQSTINVDLDSFSDTDGDETDFQPPKIKHKRPSEPRCTCGKDCRTRRCSCRRAGRACTENCGCTACKNRNEDTAFDDSAQTCSANSTATSANVSQLTSST